MGLWLTAGIPQVASALRVWCEGCDVGPIYLEQGFGVVLSFHEAYSGIISVAVQLSTVGLEPRADDEGSDRVKCGHV